MIVIHLMFFITSVLQGVNVSGYVVDEETGETIIGVNVMIEGTDLGASTDQNGFFIVRGLSPGRTSIFFSHIAYIDSVIHIEVSTGDKFLGKISLVPTILRGEAIDVTANRGNITQRDMDIASFEVNPIILKEVPQFSKDVFKLVQYSPSVTISDPFSPLFYVRGGDSGENLVQLDGMTIYNPQHFLSAAAIFNPYAIKNIEMLVGGFDAEFGGRNSSILYITSREGHQKEVRGEFKPSTDGIVGAIEFPSFFGGTAMVSGRFGSNLMSRIVMGIPNLMADFNGTYQVLLNQTRIRFSLFLARDYMDYSFTKFRLYFSDPIFQTYNTGILTNTNNVAAGMQTRTMITPSLLFESHLYYSGFDVSNKTFIRFSTKDTTQNIDVVLNYETRVMNEVSDATAKANIVYFTRFNQTWKLGCEANVYQFYNDAGIYGHRYSITNLNSILQSFYFQDKLEFGRLLLKIGIRSSQFSPENRYRLEPRASLAYRFMKSTLKAAWGTYHQYITTMNAQDYEISQYLDYYYPLRHKEPLTSTHYILGFEGRVRERIDYSVTGYYKELTTLYRFDYNSSVRSILAYQAALERGEGEAWGAEFLIRGETGKLSGWISYTYSRSTRRYTSIQNGKTFLYDGDQTHNLKTVLMLKLTPDITASTTFIFSSGFPKTWETGYASFYSYNPVDNMFGIYPTPITPVKNNVRYPPRIQWDIGWKKKLRSGFGYQLARYIGSDKAYYTLTVRNILFLHRNPMMYVYYPGWGYYAFDFEFFPTIVAGYSIEF